MNTEIAHTYLGMTIVTNDGPFLPPARTLAAPTDCAYLSILDVNRASIVNSTTIAINLFHTVLCNVLFVFRITVLTPLLSLTSRKIWIATLPAPFFADDLCRMLLVLLIVIPPRLRATKRYEV